MSLNPLLILYGSQTGTAESAAYSLARNGILNGFSSFPHSRCLALDDFDISTLPNEPLILFIISTAGNGEVPDNMKNFWKFLLNKNLPTTALINVTFSILGLGDRYIFLIITLDNYHFLFS